MLQSLPEFIVTGPPPSSVDAYIVNSGPKHVNDTADIFVEIGDSTGELKGAGSWMAGFFVLGTLLGMAGTLMITWHYHTDAEPRLIGLHFLAISGGFVLASQLLPRLFSRIPLRPIAMASAALALIALAALSVLAPPAGAGWRVAMLLVSGTAAGGLSYSLLYANQAWFKKSPASSANRAGALFVGGALLATLVAGTTYFGGFMKAQSALLAVVPALYLIVLTRNPAMLLGPGPKEDLLRDTLKDLRSIVTLLFSLLIFFQFACEWAIASWLPLFLIHTLGMNPVTGIWGLGLYFLALMAGRLLAQVLLPFVSHKKMLMASVASGMAGYLLLSLTGSTAVALTTAVIIGLSHAAIYPLIAERLDKRLSYHAGFYSGTVSLAIAGGMATPWLLGYVAESLGMRAVMLIPAVASIAVFVLAILIMLEARLMGGKQHDDDSEHGLLTSD